MSKSTKIVVSLLVVAGFVCLAIGTIFACDYISQSNNAVALDKKQVIVASANRFALPNVRIDEPLRDFVVPDSWIGTWYVDLNFFSPVPNGLYIGDLGDSTEFTVIYEGVTYDSVFVVTFLDTVYFEYNVNSFDTQTVVVTSSFYIVIESSVIDLYDYNDYHFSPDEVISILPDGFLTREKSFGVKITDQLLGILVSGLTGIGQGLGESLSPIATAIFVNTAGDGLSVFGILIAVFAAISLGLSFTRFVLNFVTSWGNRNR